MFRILLFDLSHVSELSSYWFVCIIILIYYCQLQLFHILVNGLNILLFLSAGGLDCRMKYVLCLKKLCMILMLFLGPWSGISSGFILHFPVVLWHSNYNNGQAPNLIYFPRLFFSISWCTNCTDAGREFFVGLYLDGLIYLTMFILYLTLFCSIHMICTNYLFSIYVPYSQISLEACMFADAEHFQAAARCCYNILRVLEKFGKLVKIS
jgi:hypothetical protein